MLSFCLAFLFIYLVSFLLVLKNYDKEGKYKGKKKETIPLEASFFLKKYPLDFSHYNFKTFLRIIYLINSFLVSLVFVWVLYFPFKKKFFNYLTGVLLIIPLILLSYGILGKYFKKKGLIKK